MKHIATIIITAGWLAGIAIAKGFFSTIFSIMIPPYAFYLVVEKLVVRFL
jgi:hypothetical protein